MKRRSPLLRLLAGAAALLQLTTPPLSAVADGLAARDSAGERVAHVESTTTSRCPVVHAPDCGVCRYLTTCGAPPLDAATPVVIAAVAPPARTNVSHSTPAAAVLPDGRAPPV
jgi:hypothetical protein